MKTIHFPDRNWRPDDHTLIHTGAYRVGEDISEELAARAVREGVAVAVADEAKAEPPKRKAKAPA